VSPENRVGRNRGEREVNAVGVTGGVQTQKVWFFIGAVVDLMEAPGLRFGERTQRRDSNCSKTQGRRLYKAAEFENTISKGSRTLKRSSTKFALVMGTFRGASVVLVAGPCVIPPGTELWANMGRTSGGPSENFMLDWLETGLKSTGFVFRSLLERKNHLGDARYIPPDA